MNRFYKMDFEEFIDTNINRYDYAIIDPPWNYDDKPNNVMIHQVIYNLWDNIKLRDIFDKLDVNYIFLWITNSMLPLMFKYLENSKYVFKILVPWLKMTENNEVFFGPGNTFRNCVEYLAVLQKKDAKILRFQFRNVIIDKVGKRTEKPKEFEQRLCSELNSRGLSGVYIFSGGELDFIDSVDIYSKKDSKNKVELF